MSEISIKAEIQETFKPQEENYRKIRSNGEMTDSEVKEFWNNLFKGEHTTEHSLVSEKGEEVNKEGLTGKQKEKLKEVTGWSDEILDAIGSWEEAEIYLKADLKEEEINGKSCLIRKDINLDQKDEDGITNRERMERGRPPITKDGDEVELHHIGQKQNSPLAELTTEQHRSTNNDTILHDKTKESEIDRNEFGKERRNHWKDRAKSIEGGK